MEPAVDYHPLKALTIPSRFPNYCVLNPRAMGIPVDEYWNRRYRNHWLLAEWHRPWDPDVWGHDKSLYEEDIDPESYESIRTCLSLLLEVKDGFPNRYTVAPTDVDDWDTPWDSGDGEPISDTPQPDRRLVYLPEADFKIRPAWYHRADGQIIAETTRQQLVNPIEYTADTWRDKRCALDAVKEAIDDIQSKCASRSCYLMQLQRWRRHRNPV